MKVEKKDNNRERLVLTSMIVSTEVLSQIASKWEKEGLFKSTWANVIGGWCTKYYDKYGKAPKKDIENIFTSWADENGDKETVSLVERLLNNLSGKYEKTKKKLNPQYTLDQAGEYFDEVATTKLAAAIQGDIEVGKVKDALKRIHKFTKPEIGTSAEINLLQDLDAIRDAFETPKESIIKYPGALGQFFGDELEREGFIAFMGPQKRGKSWWLLDMAWRAMCQRRRVAYFQVGDMSKRQTLRRFGIRAAGIPRKPTKPDHPLIIPRGLERDGKEVTISKMKEKHFKEGITWGQVVTAFEKTAMQTVRSKNPYMKVSVHPTSSITVGGLRGIIQGWERQSWVPDVVVIDYADILAAPHGFIGDSRDAINDTWKALRRMSQELHCLVVTATQAKASSYTAESLTMEHFSEDNRKFSHVTGMIGINQKDDEKSQGIQRLNWLVLREDEFLVSRHVHVAGCLGLANPAMVSI